MNRLDPPAARLPRAGRAAQLHARRGAGHLSQPAFSALIRQLEDDARACACSTATRAASSSRPKGASSRPRRGACSPSSMRRSSGMRDHAARRRGRVSIALLPSLAAGWLPGGAGRLSRPRIPGIELQVADVLSEAVHRAACAAGQADFALAAIRADTPELRAELFCSDDFHLVCPRRPPARDAARTCARATWRPDPSSTCRARAACASTSTRRCIRAAAHRCSRSISSRP